MTKRKHMRTDAERANASERMRLYWTDPEFQAKQKAGRKLAAKKKKRKQYNKEYNLRKKRKQYNKEYNLRKKITMLEAKAFEQAHKELWGKALPSLHEPQEEVDPWLEAAEKYL